MAKTEVNIPKVRFKGFKDGWHFTKFKDIYSKVRNGFVGIATPYYVDEGITYVQGRNIKAGKLLDNGYVNISNDFHMSKPNSTLEVNDLLMVQSGHVGECAVVTSEYKGANCHAILVATPKSNELCDSNLYVNYFLSDFGRNKIHMITTGNTIQHILSSDLKEISIPKISIQEQTQIGHFFQKLDQVIELQQKALETTKDYKKSMLQKMFPQKGEKVPQIRFDGFSGDWGEAKLGQLLKTYSFKSYLAEPSLNGKFPVIQQGDNPVVGYSDQAPFRDYDHVVLFGDHTLSLFKPMSPFLVATDGIKIIYIDNFDNNFTYCLLFFYLPVSEGYKRHFSILKEQISYFPNLLEEQQKIGAFFQKLDQQIEQQEKKLENYQQLKKAMLQRLFV